MFGHGQFRSGHLAQKGIERLADSFMPTSAHASGIDPMCFDLDVKASGSRLHLVAIFTESRNVVGGG
jgi:hypothetical protein